MTKLSSLFLLLRKLRFDSIVISFKVEYSGLLEKYDLEEDVIVSALCYDLLSLEDIRSNFGEECFNFCRYLLMFDKLALKAGRWNRTEVIKKMLIATTSDLRVIVVKLLERLHEMRNLHRLNDLERRRIAEDSLEIYSPMAYRLGLEDIKWELEDLSFKYLNHKEYVFIKNKFALKRTEREKLIVKLENILKRKLADEKIFSEIFGRVKHFYSINKKMKLKNKRFEDIKDLYGIRIIVKEIDDCYNVLGIVNGLFEEMDDKFKDYISSPRDKFYQSLHNSYWYEGYPVEIQIRTEYMNDVAEEGIAAHWKYKEIKGDDKFQKQLGWMKQILSAKSGNDKRFLHQLKVDLFGNNLFCFTPKGEIVELKSLSCVVDFAYAIHSEIGDKCTGARVNGKFVGLRHKLMTGDEVEILTSSLHKPSRDWLGFVISSKAIERIKQSLSLRGMPTRKRENIKDDSENSKFIKVIGDYDFTLAKCCNPLPFDRIKGGVVGFRKVLIHSRNCENLLKIKINVDAFWREDFSGFIALVINADDRVGLFAEILNAVASLGINVSKAGAKNLGSDIAECSLDINFSRFSDLGKVIRLVKGIEGIRKVRIE